jgi:hypothetical protein
MRRTILLLFLVCTLLGNALFPAVAQEQKHTHHEIPIIVDGLAVAFDVQPILESNRILIPFRAIADALGVAVDWDANTQKITAANEDTIVVLQIDNKTSYLNGMPIALDVPPTVRNSRTLVPLRFFSEAFNCNVQWNSKEGIVKIASASKKMAIIGFYALGDKQTSSWTNLFGSPYPETNNANTDVIGELALGWYSLDAAGNLLTKSKSGWQRPDGWEDVLSAASKYNMATEMVVHLTDGDGTLSALLGNKDAMNRAVNEIIDEAMFYKGINLDFEGLGYRDYGEELKMVQESFSHFVGLLAGQAQVLGLELTLTLHAPNSVYKGYDYKSLGKVADRIIIMAYDYGPRPEPEDLIIQAVEQSLKNVPKEKLFLGISIPSENPVSMSAKIEIAKRYRLGGIALWRLGLLSEDMWGILKSTVEF